MDTDLLLKDGLVIDGSSGACVPVRADIAIDGDCIQEVGDLSGTQAKKTVSIKGMYAVPGFIDAHAHSEFLLLADGRAEGKICQGITTEINGNCGMSAAPLFGPALEQREKDLDDLGISERWSSFQEYYELLEKRGHAVNFATLVGHGSLRASAAGYEDRPLTREETARICELISDAVQSGAKGISTGLIYPPGIYSHTSELIEFARELKTCNGIYATHMRDEGDNLLESIDEVLTIARESGTHAHISHLKTSGQSNWGKLPQVFDRIDSANENHISVTFDRYPYIASSTDLDAVLPSWAFEGGRKKELQRLQKDRKKLAGDVLARISDESFWDKIVISSLHHDRNKWMEGKSLLVVSAASGTDPMDLLFNVLIDEELQVGAIFFTMSEINLKSILRHPQSIIGSDSSARSYDGITSMGKPHPRGFGTFPRVLGKYVREQGVLHIGEAIYKMTGLPAGIFRIARRGVIKKGYFADITIFNPGTVDDCADFSMPYRKPEGIHHVFVNGTPVVFEGEVTGALPGRILR